MSGTKEVILMRHGECESNATDIHQAGNQVEGDPLTAKGHEQARGLAERFRHIGIEVLISSGYLRARQTATPIAEVTGAPHVVPVFKGEEIVDLDPHDPQLLHHRSLLREIDVAPELEGLHYKDPKAVEVKQGMREIEYQPDIRFSGEENLHDLWRRAEAIRTYLESRPEKTIAVVAHGGILKVWLAHVMFGDHLDKLTKMQQMAAYRAFAGSTWWDNTGVVSMQLTPDEGWRWLMTDIQHLHPKFFNYMPGHQQEMPGGDKTEGESRSLE